MKNKCRTTESKCSQNVESEISSEETMKNIGSINMTDNHSLFFSPDDGTKDFGAVLHEVQEYISGKYSTLIIDGEKKMGKRRSNGTSANTSWITELP